MKRLMLCVLLVVAGLAAAGCESRPPSDWKPYGAGDRGGGEGA